MQQIPIHLQTASRVIEDGLKPTSLLNGLLDVETECPQPGFQIAGLRHELERVQKRRRNDLVPCFKLPVEILSRVFSYVRDMCNESDQSLKQRLEWIVMAGVCQLWRAVVLDLSQLWTDIDISMNAEWIQNSLERSRQASLNVSIPSGVKARNEPQLLATLEQLHRCRILRVSLPNNVIYSKTRFMKDLSVVFDRISSTVTPLLETLVLAHVHVLTMSGLDGIIHPSFTIAGAPNLRHLQLLGWRLPWSSSLFSGLTSLKITSPQFRLHGTLEELFQTLGRLPELKELYLAAQLPRGTGASLQSQTIQFRQLDTIILYGGVADAIIIFRHIAIPLSARVTIMVNMNYFGETRGSSKTPFSDLTASLTSAWLSGQISESSSTPHTKHGARSLEIEDDGEGLTIRGWMDNVDHAKRHPEANLHPFADSSIPPASFTISVESCAAPQLLCAFLSAFPLHKLKSIYLDIQPTKRGWDALAKLPSLQSISLTRHSAVEFCEYVNHDPVMEAFSDEGQLELEPELTSVRFHNLAHLSFDNVNFGLGEYTTDIKAIDWHDFYDSLMYRCELNVPIHHLRFSKCANVWEIDVLDARGVVSDVDWDGYTSG